MKKIELNKEKLLTILIIAIGFSVETVINFV